MSHNTKSSTKLLLKDIFLNCITESTSHGLPSIIRTKRIQLKLMWLLFFILSTCACSFLVARMILAYFKFEVISQITVIHESPAAFPTVTICNIHGFNTHKSVDFKRQIFSKNNITDIFSENLINLSNMSEIKSSFFRLKFLMQLNSMDPSMNDSARLELNAPLNNMLISCSFGPNRCTESDFELFFHRYYGNCNRFNSNKQQERLVMKSGKLYGLKLELFVGFDENLGTFQSNRGAHLFIHNKSNILSSESFDVPASLETDIRLSRTRVFKLGPPHSNCVQEGDFYDSLFYNIIINQGYAYKQSDCFDLCFQQYLIKNCSCYEPSFNSLSYNKPCLSLADSLCEMNAFERFLNKNNMDKCLLSCPLECNSKDFEYTLSFSQFPTEEYAKQLRKLNRVRALFGPNRTTNYDDIKKNFLSINLFYEDFKVNLIEEVAKLTIEDLLSNIGGTLGLYTGISFLSFV
jgi:hypothetical protein